MKNKIPFVSVLMTAFNRELFIAEAIQSVLDSTFKDFELIIVDDCSSDNTNKIARQFESKDPRVKVFLNEKNLGDYPNRNRAISYATAEYIMFVDSDDKIHIDGIENCVNTMMRFPSSSYGIYSSKLNRDLPLASKNALHIHFFEMPFLIVGPGGTIQRREFINSIGGYPEKYGPANDMYYHLLAASKTDIVLLNFEFTFYRRHDGQEINNSLDYLWANFKYLNDFLNTEDSELQSKERKWIANKNKRRFIINIFYFLLKSRNLKSTFKVWKKADFNFSYLYQGIFHLN
jgi:glycosyltransferase involved in cell wall biosynthesis